MECIRKIKPNIGVFNIYGRIVHKRAKGCSYFYELLSANDKQDGWESPCNRMENDLTNFNPEYDFDRGCFLKNVNIMKLKYFNRIKQFMIRLYRNNLFLGHNYEKKDDNNQVRCHVFNTHKESRIELLLKCSIINKLLQLMIRTLKKAGCLASGCSMDMFLFNDYPVNSIENITLIFT